MSKIEEILDKSTLFSSEHIFNKIPVFDAMQQTALAFTKWKDDNTYIVDGVIFSRHNGISYTTEQLFDEWKNLK